MEQINTYIEQSRQNGQTDEQIRQALIASGWNAEQVNSVLGGLPVPIPEQAPVQPTPVASADPALSPTPPQSTPAKRRSRLPFVAGSLAVLLIIVAGGVFALSSHKASYQTVIQSFITAMQKKDKAKADALESPAAQAFFKKTAGTTSFYDACQQVGELCTASFNASYLAKATKTYKEYTASNDTKGMQLIYTIKQSVSGSKAGGQGCSGDSTSTLTVSVIPKGNSWLVDNLDQTVDAKGELCLAPGGISSVGD